MKKILLLFAILFMSSQTQIYSQTFSAKTDFATGTSPQQSIAIGDFNGDGKLDITVPNFSSSTVSVFLSSTSPGATTASFSAKTDFTTGTNPRYVAIGDFNGDGKLDMAVASSGTNKVSVFLNNTSIGAATASFSAKTDFTAGSTPISVAIGDFNGDGKPDMAVANFGSNTVSVFLNNIVIGATTASFSAKTDFATGSSPNSVAIGDFNGDGKPDIAIANSGTTTVSVFLNNITIGATTASFSIKTDYTTGTTPQSVAIGDLNGDGKLDLAVANFGSNTVSVFLNHTSIGAARASFSAKVDSTTGSSPRTVVLRDLNGDGKLDMAITNGSSNTVSIYLNTTSPGAITSTFDTKNNFTTGTNPIPVATGDFNGDGKIDMVVGNGNSNTISVFLNTTTIGSTPTSFSTKVDSTTGTAPISISIGDMNGDGKSDLTVTNFNSNSVSVFLNTTTPGASTPSFSVKTDFTTGTSPRSVFIGDFNGDDKPDLATANQNSTSVSVFLNTTTPGASTPSFSAKTDFTTGNTPVSVSIGDLNGDGKPDLAVANANSTSVSVFLNTTTPGASTPTFSVKADFTTGSSPRSLSIGDLNGDGKPDLAVGNWGSNSVSVFLNTTTPGASTPTFSAKTDFTTGTNPRSVSIGDLNGDGKPDLVVPNSNSASVSVFLNTTTPGASTPSFSVKTDFTTGVAPFSVSIGDLNGDGKPDLTTANLTSNSISVFLNTTTPGASTPTFSAKADFTTGSSPNFVSIGELNGDGKPDLAVTNQNSNSISMFLNNITLPLPVELVSFSASVSGSSVNISWNTATEVNNYGFEIERSSVGNSQTTTLHWEKIGFVPGFGNSNSPHNYSFTDNSLFGGNVFSYRLKQIDNDGKFEYSDVLTISLVVPKKAQLLQNIPNPFNPSTSIKFFVPNISSVTVKIYDMLGKEVATLVNNQLQAGFHIVFWNGRDRYGYTAASGVYLYRLTTKGGGVNFTDTKKMTLLK